MVEGNAEAVKTVVGLVGATAFAKVDQADRICDHSQQAHKQELIGREACLAPTFGRFFFHKGRLNKLDTFDKY